MILSYNAHERILRPWFKFRRWYCTHNLPFHNKWVTRVMHREFGVSKEWD